MRKISDEESRVPGVHDEARELRNQLGIPICAGCWSPCMSIIWDPDPSGLCAGCRAGVVLEDDEKETVN